MTAMTVQSATSDETRLLREQQAGLLQPQGERSAQDQLPRSSDPLWLTLAKSSVEYDDETGMFSIDLPPEVKALDGQTVSVKGFVLPMDGSDHTRHFLVTRNTPVCFFCPPGTPYEVIEVTSSKAVAWTDNMVTVKGKMKLINNGEKALFFQIAASEVTQ